MSSLLTELTERARRLPTEEGARLAEGLLESLPESATQEVEAAWDAEILRRIGEYESGDATLVPVADVFAQARRLTQ